MPEKAGWLPLKHYCPFAQTTLFPSMKTLPLDRAHALLVVLFSLELRCCLLLNPALIPKASQWHGVYGNCVCSYPQPTGGGRVVVVGSGSGTI